MAFQSPTKAELVQSFLRSKTRGTSGEQVQLSRRSLENPDSITYEQVDFYTILKDNDCDYPKIAVAFELLLKYITNLLSERLPQNWWSINAKLPQFVHRIGNVKGAKDVLKTAGYCIEEVGTLSFPEDKRKKPDRELLSVVSAELLIAKAECERARRGGREWLPSPLRQQQQQGFVKKASPEEDELCHNLSDIPAQPPHPNQWTGHDKLSHPGGPHHFSGQSSSHFQPTSSPNAEERQQPVAAATHPQHAHVASTLHVRPEESLGFQTSPSPDYSDDSAGLGRHRYHQEQPSPSDFSHSSDDRPHSRGRDFVYNGGLTTGQLKRTGQEAFQQIDQLGQAIEEEQATREEQAIREDAEEKQEDAVEDEQEEDVHVEENQEEAVEQEQEEAVEREQEEDEEEEVQEDVEDCQESGTAGSEAASQGDSSDEAEKAGSDNDASLPDAKPSSVPAWKHRSQNLLQIMRKGTSGADCSGVPHRPFTTTIDLCPVEPLSSAERAKKAIRTSFVRHSDGNTSPPREKCVRFGQVAHTDARPDEQPAFPVNDPSDPNQVEMQECKSCKNRVSPGSNCGYCNMPCPKKRTRKIRTAEQLAQPAGTAPEASGNPPSSVPPAKTVALPPSVSSGQQNRLSSPLSQASPTQPSPPAPSEHTGELLYPPSCQKGSSSYQEPTVAGSMFAKNPSAAAATASAQVYHHPTDFDRDRPEFKRCKEAEYFSRLPPEKQRDYLDEKRSLGDEVGHLLPHFHQAAVRAPLSKQDTPDLAASPHCDIESHRKKREAEAKWFSTLSPARQREVLNEKERLKDEISHLIPHLKEEKEQVRTGRKMVDDKVMASLKEERKREQMKKDGAIFVHHIKMCTRHGFAPEEVEIAYKKNRNNPLDYLKEDWLQEIERVKLGVRCFNPGGQSVGEPSMNEVRLALIESRGDSQQAVVACSSKRRAKVSELMRLVSPKIRVSWEEAVEVLTTCNLQVEEAFNELQRRRLQPLYNFIFGDYQVFTQNTTEMDFLKKLAMKGAKKEGEEYQAHLRMLTAECKFHNTAKAELLIKLLEDNSGYPMRYYIDATSNYNTFEDAQRFLNQPCPICIINYPMDDMVVMPGPCGHSMCKECFRSHFEITIREKSVKHFNCPECGQPDIGDLGEIKDFYLELFVALIKEHVSGFYELCQQKLRDYALSKEPGFVWCSFEGCRSGFINERPDRYRLDCPTCHKPMCFHCKKPWETQHEGLTCEQFTNWKADNDPEAQKAGLAAHLEENGIECPECKMRYDLAQGGCMHFRCTQCPCEFCSGCFGRFKNGQACGKFDTCKARGLHAHHPRDCLYFLRDFTVADLQKLLTDKGIKFDTEPRQTQIDAQQRQKDKQKEQDKEEEPPEHREVAEEPPEHREVAEEPLEPEEGEVDDEEEEEGRAIGGNQLAAAAAVAEAPPVKLTCCVMLQKEVPNGLVDEKCGKNSPKGMAGLCEVHYKEYLVRKINKNHLDPVELYDLNGVKQILKREEIEIPEQEDDENEVDYRRKLIEQIREDLPIEKDAADQ